MQNSNFSVPNQSHWSCALSTCSVLSVAALAFEGQSWIVLRATTWNPMSKIVTIWCFTEKSVSLAPGAELEEDLQMHRPTPTAMHN